MFTNKSHPRWQRNQEARKSGENQIFLPHCKEHKEPAVHFHLAGMQTSTGSVHKIPSATPGLAGSVTPSLQLLLLERSSHRLNNGLCFYLFILFKSYNTSFCTTCGYTPIIFANKYLGMDNDILVILSYPPQKIEYLRVIKKPQQLLLAGSCQAVIQKPDRHYLEQMLFQLCNFQPKTMAVSESKAVGQRKAKLHENHAKIFLISHILSFTAHASEMVCECQLQLQV